MKGSRPIFDSFQEASECARIIATTTGYETVVIRHDENWAVQLQIPSSPDESQSGVLEHNIQYEQSGSDIIDPNHEIDTLKLRIDPTLQHKVDFESYEAATEYAKSIAASYQCHIDVKRDGSNWTAVNPLIEAPIEDEPTNKWNAYLSIDDDFEPRTLIERIESRRRYNKYSESGEFADELNRVERVEGGWEDHVSTTDENVSDSPNDDWYYPDDDNDPWD